MVWGQDHAGFRARDASSRAGACRPRDPATYAAGMPRDLAGRPHPAGLAPRAPDLWFEWPRFPARWTPPLPAGDLSRR